MEKLVLTMGVWQGTANSLQGSLFPYYVHALYPENGSAFCRTRYSILIMGCLNMQQGMSTV